MVFYNFELFSVIIFTIEYLGRLWSCTADPRYSHPLWGRLKRAREPIMILDLLAVAPFYLPIFLNLDLRFVRVLRLFRLLRIFKLARYSKAVRVLFEVIRTSKEQLMVTLFLLFVLLIFASSLMYYVESYEASMAGRETLFTSIPAAMWWGVATMTTVGYGDIYPVSPMGKFFGSVLALLGVGLFALPAGIIASGFSERLRSERDRKRGRAKHNLRKQPPTAIKPRAASSLMAPALVQPKYCPHCGKHVPPIPASAATTLDPTHAHAHAASAASDDDLADEALSDAPDDLALDEDSVDDESRSS